MAIEHIEVTYRVITPMFCGGARGTAAALRLPSFKGVLRWWWRAMAWSAYAGNLKEIQDAEDLLFGSARRGQGNVVMRFASVPRPKVVSPPAVLRLSPPSSSIVGDGARYLGYGVMEAFGRRATPERREIKAGELTRACLLPPLEFRVALRCHDLDVEARELLLDALRALGTLGGLGAKSRKGYGSIALQALVVNGSPAWSPPQSLDDLANAIERLHQQAATAFSSNELPRYTALSPRARHILLRAEDQPDALGLLDRVGREMMWYRSWGHDERVLGKASEKNFRPDHDLMMLRGRKTAHPERIVFGLPHNYGKQPYQEVTPAEPLDRRASPLLIHVHECGATPVAVLSFLPARFLPEGDAATINVGGTPIPLAADPRLWEPIEDLLERYMDRNPGNKPRKQRKEKFTDAREVPS